MLRDTQRPRRRWELRVGAWSPAGRLGQSLHICRQQTRSPKRGDSGRVEGMSTIWGAEPGTSVHVHSGPGTHRVESEGLCGLRRELNGSGNVSVQSRGRGKTEDNV